MNNDIIAIKHAWNRKFGEVFDEDVREVRVIPSPDKRGFFRVSYSQKLEEWYNSPDGRTRYSKPTCFFCDRHDEFIKMDLIKTIDHLNVFFNLKFVMRNHLLIAPGDHRELPTVTDVVTLQRFAMLSGLSVFGNFRDSGAGFPSHVHYQTLETEFPIVSQPGNILCRTGGVVVGGVVVEAVHGSMLALRFSPLNGKEWTPDAIGLVGAIVTSQPGASNLMFFGKDVYLIPRTKSIPSNTDGFKFAAAEVCGSIYIREKRMFDLLDAATLMNAMRDVCLPYESSESSQYINRLLVSI